MLGHQAEVGDALGGSLPSRQALSLRVQFPALLISRNCHYGSICLPSLDMGGDEALWPVVLEEGQKEYVLRGCQGGEREGQLTKLGAAWSQVPMGADKQGLPCPHFCHFVNYLGS